MLGDNTSNNQNTGQIVVACPVVDRQRFNSLNDTGVTRLLFFDTIEGHDYRFSFSSLNGGDSNQIIDLVEHPPLDFDLLAIVYISVNGEAGANTFKDALAECGAAYQGVAVIPLTNANALDTVVARLLMERLLQAQANNARLALQMATLRRDYEQQMENFTMMEEFVSKRGVKLLDLEFSYNSAHPNERNGSINWDSWRLADGSFDLRQRLAVSSRGLAIIGLPITRMDVADDLILVIELWTLENQRQVSYWTIDTQKIKTDWIHLVLPRALGGMPLTPELRIKCSRWVMPSIFRLGGPHPVTDFCLRTGEGRALPGPLAIKLWKSVAGMSVPKFVGNTIVAGGTAYPSGQSDIEGYTVSLERMRHIKPAIELPEKLTFHPVAFWEEHTSILVHPLEGKTVIAYLPGGIQEPVCRLSLAIELANEKAQPMEFAAAWLTPEIDAKWLFHEAKVDPSIGFSGWVRLSALERMWLNIVVPTAGGSTGDLYFASRPAQDATGLNGWLFVRRIDYLAAPKR